MKEKPLKISYFFLMTYILADPIYTGVCVCVCVCLLRRRSILLELFFFSHWL